MSELICKLGGSRGRSIEVYDNKCVITTDVTLGSVLTSNALDGKKTIFYIDVTGIQFKASGFTIGYLQLETPSMQMNNQSSNMFSENTYTFEDGINGAHTDLIRATHDYIVDRIEGYKYGVTPSAESLHILVDKLKKYGIRVGKSAENFVLREQQKKAEAAEKARIETEQRKQEEAQLKAAEWKKLLEESGNDNWITDFLTEAASSQRISDIKNLWDNFPKESGAISDEIESMIKSAAQIERMYGGSSNRTTKLLESIRTKLSDN